MTLIRGLRVIQTDAGLVAAEEYHVTGVATDEFVDSLAAQGGSGAELTWDADLATYVPTSLHADTSLRREFFGPTDPSSVDGVVMGQYDTWTVTT